MIDIEARNGESTARDADRQTRRCCTAVTIGGCVGHHQKEEGLHSKATAIEELPHVRRGHDSPLSKVIRQQTTEWNDDRHQQMGQRTQEAGLK